MARMNPESVTVGQIMSQPAVAVEAHESAWVAMQRLTTSGVRHLVVQLVLDLIGDTRPSVTTRTTAAEAAGAMLAAGVDALPVVDADDRVVGLVTGSDLLRLLADAGSDSPSDARPAISRPNVAPD